MKTIMTITHSEDKTVDYLIHKYQERIKWYRLNADQLDKYEISMTENGIRIKCSEYEIMGNQIYSLLYRKIIYPDLSKYPPLYLSLLRHDVLTFVEGLAEIIGEVCLSRPSVLRRAENKMVQLQAAKIEEFSIPDTLITNSANNASDFVATYPSVIKPLSTGVVRDSTVNGIIQTNVVDISRPISDIGIEPSYFQQYTPKNGGEYRVTIVGREYVAVRIDSDHPIDWRKKGASNKYELVEFPNSIIQKCYNLMDRLEISFGAFDFIYTGSEYFFLEVNPNGQWLWLELELNTPISELIVRYLERGDSK